MRASLIGGVRDGEFVTLPRGAAPGVYKERQQNKGQTTDYVLRESGRSHAMVAEGMKWPILEGAAA